MAGIEKQVMHLRAGRVIKAGGFAIVPVLRFTSMRSARAAVCNIEPIAVILLAGDQVQAWRADGSAESAQRLLQDVPDLAGLIEAIRAGRDENVG